MAAALKVLPLTPGRWEDFARLFGPNGACAGCWCQWCRLPAAEFRKSRGGGARRIMRGLVSRGARPGLLAYEGREAVGWCAVGPREEFRRLTTSRVLKPVDSRAVWSAPCLFVARSHRRRGVAALLLREAARHARLRGARWIEGYPVDTRGGRQADAFLWWGTASAFRRAGYREVARRSPSRPIMRRRAG